MLIILGIIYTMFLCVPTLAILGKEKTHKKQDQAVFSKSWHKWAVGLAIIVMIAMMSIIAHMD